MRKTSGYQVKKFNVGKLKERAVKILYAQRIGECLTDFNDSESINEDWKAFRDIITTTADAVLDKAGKMEQNNCEQATSIKNEAYRKMQQKNHTSRAAEEYRMAQREEKRVRKKKKKNYSESEFGELEHSGNMNDSKAFYRKINKNGREFQHRTTLCRDKEGTIDSGNELIMKRWTEHFNELLNSNVTGTSEDISTIDNPLDI
jgi:hypothetical protein